MEQAATRPRPPVHASRRWLVLGCWAITACGGRPTTQEGRAPRSRDGLARPPVSCVVGAVERQVLRLDGRDTYVEPQWLGARDGTLLLAGARSFEWTPRVDGSHALERDRILGVRIAGEAVSAIGRPPGLGPIGWLRAARLSADRWAWLLAGVVDPDAPEWRPTDVRYAEYAGGAWSDTRPVPIPDATEASFFASSPLLPDSVEPGWVLPVVFERGWAPAMAYRRGDASFDVIDTRDVEAAQLADDPELGRWALLSGPEPELGTPRTTVRTVRLRPLLGSPRAELRLWVGRPGEKIFHPRLTADSGSFAAGWLSLPADGPQAAWAARGIRPGATYRPVRIDDRAERVVPVRLPGGPVVWVVHHVGVVDSQSGELRVYTLDAAGRPALLRALPYPFTGYFDAVATAGGQLVIAGPELVRDPAHPIVRSLLLRLSVSCL